MSLIRSCLILLLISICLRNTISQISVLAPENLQSVKINTYDIAKFSDIQFGKTMRGYILYSDIAFCDFADTFPEIDKDFYYADVSKPDNALFVMINHTSQCSYSKLATGAKKIGAKLLIIVSDDSSLKESFNVEDKVSSSINLPTIIIKKEDSLKIVEEFKKGTDVQISITFQKIKKDKQIQLELYLRSDKSSHFFKEFKQYFKLLEKKIKFTPVYKYYGCIDCTVENSLSEIPENSCVRSNDFCGYSNHSKFILINIKYTELQITNGRLMVLENLRQECLFIKQSISTYWNYMVSFSEKCASRKSPNFNTKCAESVMSELSIEKSDIEKCMLDAMNNSKNTILSNDDAKYESNYISKIPTLLVNGIKYKGSFFSHTIFETLCNDYFSDDPEACNLLNLSVEEEPSSNAGSIILIMLALIICLIVVVILYKKFIEKSLDETIAEKIKKQAQGSLGQYHIFQDRENSIVKKGVDIEKL